MAFTTYDRLHVFTYYQIPFSWPTGTIWITYSSYIIRSYKYSRCRYNMAHFIKILHTALRWQQQNVNQTLNSQHTPRNFNLWGVYCENSGENWSCYNGTVLWYKTPVVDEDIVVSLYVIWIRKQNTELKWRDIISPSYFTSTFLTSRWYGPLRSHVGPVY